MSDIVIKNGKLPPNCWDCKYESNLVPDCPCWNGTADASDYRQSRYPFCPIKELPEHGRLGDLDKLASKVAEAQEQMRGKDYDPFMLLGDVLRWIGLTPTVLEASK